MRYGRIAIVFDGKAWHVRRIRVIEHDLDRDEKIYRCDLPIANDVEKFDDVAALLRSIAAESRRERLEIDPANMHGMPTDELALAADVAALRPISDQGWDRLVAAHNKRRRRG